MPIDRLKIISEYVYTNSIKKPVISTVSLFVTLNIKKKQYIDYRATLPLTKISSHRYELFV